MNRIENKFVGRIICLAIGVSILFGSQAMFAQSAANPPKTPATIMLLEAEIKKTRVELDQVVESIKDSNKSADVLRNELGALEKLGTTMSVSAESYPEVLKTLHSQRVQLSIDLAGIDARYKAIKEASAKIAAQQAEGLLKPLQQLVDIHTAEVERMKELSKAGSISTTNLREAEIALLEAKTRLAQVGSPTGGTLGHLNRQLLDTSLERAEKSARLEKAISLVKEVDAYRSHVTDVAGKHQLIGSIKFKQARLEDEKRALAESLLRLNNSLQETRDEMP